MTYRREGHGGGLAGPYIEYGVRIGAAVLLLPVRIGRMAVIGGGAVVTKDVEPGSVVLGVPAAPREEAKDAPIVPCKECK